MIIVLLLRVTGLTAQEYYFSNYGVSDGLSSSKVYTVIQDESDYLWLGTESGATRWNGSEFENFSSDDGLATGAVKSIFQDHRGRIWLGHLNGGLTCYENDEFHTPAFDTLEINGDITGILEYDGKLWITSQFNGALSAPFPPPGARILKLKQYRGGQGLSDQVLDIYVDNEGDMFCIVDLGIKKYNREKDVFESYRPEGLSNYFNTTAMLEDSEGGRWFGTHNGGLYYFPPRGGDVVIYDTRDGLADNFISCITEDSKGRIWAGTFGGGISVFKGGEMRTYNDGNGLEASDILSIMEDREGNIIITSYSNGIHIFKGDHFINYISDDMFRDKNVWAITEDKHNRYWFGTNEGITLYDPEIGMPWFYYEETHNIGNKIRYIVSDKEDRLWIGTVEEGIYRYDFDRNDFTGEKKINDILYNDLMVTGLVADNSNNLWIGTNDGIAFWDTEKDEGIRYTRIHGLAGLGITAIFEDKEGKLWIGSEREAGLTRYDPLTETFEIIRLGYELSPVCITETADGTIWLGTTYGVLGLKDDTIAVHLTEEDGLLSNNISLLQADDKNGALYIGTNNGLNRFDIKEKNIKTYTENNGFVGIETRSGASFTDSRGHLWFGTANGATRLVPDRIPPPDLNPLTHIKGMTVNFEENKMKDELRLRYTQKNITFNYFSVCLTNPEAVRYRVMLEGADPGWRPETEQTTAIYSSLSPGKYTFKVTAQNSDGVWNSEPVTYDFVIKSPFYASAWFIFSVLILLAVAIVIYVKMREEHLVNERNLLEEKVAERTSELVQKSIVIEEKNRDITASIRYAERIQMAMLPPEDSFDDTFVLFLPKDIVSGDFYWMHDNGDVQFIAAVDCTGHGVPGAFMSIIGYNSLTKIVREYGLTRPAAILDQLNIEVTRSLIQRGDEVINDGMDLALIAYDKRNKTLQYAGAYNPLVIVRDGELITIKADRFPIGMSSVQNRKFTNTEVDIQAGDILYMFSDGYADQFGGPRGKKFKSLKLKNEFLRNSSLPLPEQKQKLLETLGKWMGSKTQVDDILIIGTRIP